MCPKFLFSFMYQVRVEVLNNYDVWTSLQSNDIGLLEVKGTDILIVLT